MHGTSFSVNTLGTTLKSQWTGVIFSRKYVSSTQLDCYVFSYDQSTTCTHTPTGSSYNYDNSMYLSYQYWASGSGEALARMSHLRLYGSCKLAY